MTKILILISFLIISSCDISSDSIDKFSESLELKNIKEESDNFNKPVFNSSIKTEIEIPEAENMDVNNSVLLDLPSERLEDAITQKISSKGNSLNVVNEDGSIYAIGYASTIIPMKKSGFISSRNIAYSNAVLRAKSQILRLAGEVITSQRETSIISKNKIGNDPDVAKSASILEKLNLLLDKTIDEKLKALGTSEIELEQLNQSQKEKIFSEYNYNLVSAFLSSMIKGTTVVMIAEGQTSSDDYGVAVCVKYSPELQSAASNIEKLGASKEVLGSKKVLEIINLSPEDLIPKLGAQFYKDEFGNRFVMGFGQSSYRKTESRQSSLIGIAQSKARLQAVENIKNLLAEDLVGRELFETTEKINEYYDGSQIVFTEEIFSELIQSKASSVKLSTLKLKDWQGIHPASGFNVIGAIVILTESNNINFSKNFESVNPKEGEIGNFSFSKIIEGQEY